MHIVYRIVGNSEEKIQYNYAYVKKYRETIEPRHIISYNIACLPSEGSNQTVRMHFVDTQGFKASSDEADCRLICVIACRMCDLVGKVVPRLRDFCSQECLLGYYLPMTFAIQGSNQTAQMHSVDRQGFKASSDEADCRLICVIACRMCDLVRKIAPRLTDFCSQECLLGYYLPMTFAILLLLALAE